MCGLDMEESSNSSTSLCEICMEGKSWGEMFKNKTCSHVFCSDCVRKHVGAKIEEKISMVVCPDVKCKEVLEPEFCQSILPSEVFVRWGDALCESMIVASHRVYCPYEDCSALLVDDGEKVKRETECPNCHRLFCVGCKVPWHSDMDCEDFQKLDRDDHLVVEIAKKQKWRRCPSCKFYVERTDGVGFIFAMGADWNGVKIIMVVVDQGREMKEAGGHQ
ncbi:E3 ubiquitin-protein ligase RSL1-like [Tasmannia lanceolata]|uniref:E3 ubiquitin-protein ligase RSL1-like n=1 Tax=Tasmannia lanceolata TaxID=3420 RepID=UPI0040646C1D